MILIDVEEREEEGESGKFRIRRKLGKLYAHILKSIGIDNKY